MFSGWEQRLGQAGTLFAVMDIGASGQMRFGSD
jgi:hypothetical protein